MSFFTYLFSAKYYSTMLFYCVTFLIVVVLAYRSQTNKNGELVIKRGMFWSAFAIAGVIFSITNTGYDYEMYKSIYNGASISGLVWNSRYGVEVGYYLLNVILHSIVKNADYGLAIIKLIQCFIVFESIYMMRKRIKIGDAVLAYMALFYFEAFNLIRISLAASICMLALSFLFNDRRLCSIVLAVISTLIHTSGLFFLIAFAVGLFYQKAKGTHRLLKTLIILSVPILLIVGTTIIAYLASKGIFMERYNDYLSDAGSFGVMQIVFYIPPFIMCYKINRGFIPKPDILLKDMMLVFTLYGFAIAMMGYQLGMLSRVFVLFSAPFVVLMPYYSMNRRAIILSGKRLILSSYKLVIYLYWGFRFVLTMSGIFMIDGISHYTTILM